MTLRGEPQVDQVIAELNGVWQRVPDLPFTRLLANILAAGGYSAEQFTDILFMGIPDSELLRCIPAYERVLNHEWPEGAQGPGGDL